MENLICIGSDWTDRDLGVDQNKDGKVRRRVNTDPTGISQGTRIEDREDRDNGKWRRKMDCIRWKRKESRRIT